MSSKSPKAPRSRAGTRPRRAPSSTAGGSGGTRKGGRTAGAGKTGKSAGAPLDAGGLANDVTPPLFESMREEPSPHTPPPDVRTTAPAESLAGDEARDDAPGASATSDEASAGATDVMANRGALEAPVQEPVPSLEQNQPGTAETEGKPLVRAIVWCAVEQVPFVQAIARQAGLVIVAIGGPAGDLGSRLADGRSTGSQTDRPANAPRDSIIPADGPVPCTDLRQALLNVEHELLLLGTLDGAQREDLILFAAERGKRIASLEPIVDVSMGEAARQHAVAIAFMPAFRDSAALRVFHEAADRFAAIASVSVFFAGRSEHGSLAARATDAVDVIEALVGGADLVDAGFAGPIGPAIDNVRRLHGHLTFNVRGLTRAAACGHVTDSAGGWERRVTIVDAHGRTAVLTDDRVELRDAAGRLMHAEDVGEARPSAGREAPASTVADTNPPPKSTDEHRVEGDADGGRGLAAAGGGGRSSEEGRDDDTAAASAAAVPSEVSGAASDVGGAARDQEVALAPERPGRSPDDPAWQCAAAAIAPTIRALLSPNPAVIAPGLVDPIRTAAVVETLALSLRTGQGERPSKIEAMLRRR